MNYLYLSNIAEIMPFFAKEKIIFSDKYLHIGNQYKVQINDTIYTGCVAIENDDTYSIDIIAGKYIISNYFIFFEDPLINPWVSAIKIISTDATDMEDNQIQIKLFETEPETVTPIEAKYISNDGCGRENFTKTIVGSFVLSLNPTIMIDKEPK